MTVTNTKPGDMPGAEGTKPPEVEGKTPAKEKVSSEAEQPIYTQSQTDALVHAAKSEAGRQAKAVEVERDDLKSQIKTKESELGDIQAERDALQKQTEELTSEDPKKFDLITRDKNLRDRERELKTKISGLDGREQSLTEREKKVSGFELEVLVETVADEYEDGDSKKLKKAMEVFDSPNEEQVKNIAGILFSTKAETPGAETKPPLQPDSGKTRGGSTYFTRTQITDRTFWEANKDAILEAQEAGRIRDE